MERGGPALCRAAATVLVSGRSVSISLTFSRLNRDR